MKKNNSLLCSVLLYTFFCVYFFMMLNVLIFNRINLGGQQYIMRSMNITPFYTIGMYLPIIGNPQRGFAFTNIFWNIFMFTPLGLYLPILIRNKKLIFHLFLIFLFTATVEILQWVLGVGVADIDDVILNCLGGLLGLIAYKILFVLFNRQEYRVRLFTTVASVIAGIPFLYMTVAEILHTFIQ